MLLEGWPSKIPPYGKMFNVAAKMRINTIPYIQLGMEESGDRKPNILPRRSFPRLAMKERS